MVNKRVMPSVIIGVLLLGGGTVLVLNQPKPVQVIEQSTTLVASESVTSTVKESAKDEKAPETTETVKVEETTTTVAIPTEKPADESSQPVNQAVAVAQPAPSTTQANPTPAPQPVETTTRQTTRQTTQATTTKKHIIMGGMGNSGREFPTMEAAEDWADNHPNYKNGEYGYVITPIVYSDYSQTYTVEWGR